VRLDRYNTIIFRLVINANLSCKSTTLGIFVALLYMTGLPMPDNSLPTFTPQVLDYTEQVTSELCIEHLDDDMITIVRFISLTQKLIDEWVARVIYINDEWPKGKPRLLCLDATNIKTSDMRYLVDKISCQEPKHADVSVYMVIWLEDSLASTLMTSIVRSSSVTPPNLHLQVVSSRQDALRWLRYNLNRSLKKEQ